MPIKIESHPSASGIFTITNPNSSTPRGITLPDATTTLVGTDATQTLTNKTIAASQLTGALPALDGSALTNLPVGTATAGLAYDAVGTYAFFRGPINTVVTPGSTYAGSSMQASSIMNSGTYASTVTSGGNAGAASGTWRAVGGSSSSTAGVGATTLFLRIS